MGEGRDAVRRDRRWGRPVTPILRAVTAAALTVPVVTTPAHAAAPKNPRTSPTAGVPGQCERQPSNGGYLGGGNATDPTYVIKTLKAAGFNRSETIVALAVAKGESGVNVLPHTGPDSPTWLWICARARHYNTLPGRPPSYDTGAFQINSYWYPAMYRRYNLDRIDQSSKAVRAVYLHQGKSFRHWKSTRTSYFDDLKQEATKDMLRAERMGVRW